eukprot:989856-Pelagomonas_calceolata.AAC.10
MRGFEEEGKKNMNGKNGEQNISPVTILSRLNPNTLSMRLDTQGYCSCFPPGCIQRVPATTSGRVPCAPSLEVELAGSQHEWVTTRNNEDGRRNASFLEGSARACLNEKWEHALHLTEPRGASAHPGPLDSAEKCEHAPQAGTPHLDKHVCPVLCKTCIIEASLKTKPKKDPMNGKHQNDESKETGELHD